MARWQTDTFVRALEQFNCQVTTKSPGGDYDTTNLILGAKGAEEDARLYVLGFTQEIEMVNPDDADVEMIEISDGQDSRGGLNSYDETTGILYVKIRKFFHDSGFEVINQIKDYY